MSVYAAESTSLSMEDLDTVMYEELLTEFYGVEEGYAYCSVAVNITSDTALTDTVTIGIPDAVGTNVWRVSTELTEDSNVSAVQYNNSYYYLYPVLNPEFTDEGVSFQTDKLGIFIAGGCLDDETLESFSSGASLFAIDNGTYTFDGTTYNLADGTLLDNDYATGYLFSDGRLIVTAFKKDGSAVSDYPWYASKSSITKLSFDDSITFIGYEAFYEYSNITGELVLPNSCTQIYSRAFASCEGFTGDLIIPDTVTKIESYAFSYCYGFNGDLVLGKNVNDLSSYSFAYNSFKGNLIFNTTKLTGIPAWCFNSSGFTGALIIPDTVKILGIQCFMDCGFSSLTLGSSVTLIESGSFYGCSNLSGDINIPNSVKNIEYEAFYNCNALNGKVIIPDSIKKIDNHTFYHTKFKKIVGGNNITSIGTDAFLYEVKDASDNYTTPSSPLFINVDSENSVLLDYDWSIANRQLSTNELIWTDESGKDYYDTDALVTWDISENEDGSVIAYLFDTDSDTIGETVVLDGVGTTVGFDFQVCSDTQIRHALMTYKKYTINHRGFGYKDMSDTHYAAPWTLPAYKNNIKHFYITNTSNISFNNASSLFYNLSNLTSIDFSNASFSNVTDMSDMFYGCSSLTTLDLSSFDTSNVTDMYCMFNGCSSLTSLDLSSFDTSNVTYMHSMFKGCSGLTSLNINNFNTSKVTDMRYMFDGCVLLTTLDVSKFDTSKVTNMHCMFYDCSSLTTLDVSNFKTSKVTDMSFIFSGCSSLTTLDVSNFNTSNVTDIQYMFNGCSSLTTLDVSHFNTSNVTDMGNMFQKCSLLTSLDLSSFNTSNVTYMNDMFNGCSSLTSLDFSSFDTSKVTNMHDMFNDCNLLTSLDLSSFNTSAVTNMKAMFCNCSSLTTLNLSSFDTSNVTDMGYMFSDCESLTTLDLSNFDTTKVTNMKCMFSYCKLLTTLNVSNFNTSSVTDMCLMFDNCSSLTSLDVSNFSNSNAIDISWMFYNCSSLTSLDLSNFNTSNATDTSYMFCKCSSLTTLNLSNFNTNRVTNMSDMFSGCSSLTTLDISNFDMSSVTKHSFMFYNCTALEELKTPSTNSIEGIALPISMYTWADNTKYTNLPVTTGTSLTLHNTTVDGEWLGAYYGLLDEDGDGVKETVYVSGTITDTTPVYGPNYSKPKPNYQTYGFYKVLSDHPDVTKAIINCSLGERTNTGCLFAGCTQLESLQFGTNFDTSKVTDMTYMFHNCKSLTTLDLSNFNTSNVTNMGNMFYGCSALTSLNISNFDTSNVTDMRYMFIDCSSLTSLDVSNFNTSKVTAMFGMFKGCNKLTSLNISNFNTVNVTSMQYMFAYCSSLTTLDLSNFNTSKVEYMNGMFHACSSLTTLDLSNFNTSEVTTMYEMFSSCSSLTTLDTSNFNTSNVKSMSNMFYYCSSLTTLDVSNFNTSKVTKMDYMFSNCSSLISLNISSFNTNNVTTMNSMFKSCSSLTSLDLSNFDMSAVTDATYMFTNCTALDSLKTPKHCTVSDAALPCTMYDGDFNEYTVLPQNSEVSISLVKSPVIILNTEDTLQGSIEDSILHITGTGSSLNISLSTVIPSSTFLSKITGVSFDTDSIESICDSWAKDTNISGRLVLPDSLVTIGNEAFYGLPSVNKITIGDAVTSIGTNAFFVDTTEKITTMLSSNNSVATEYNWDGDNRLVCGYILNTAGDLFGNLDSNGILNITGTGTVLDKKLSDVLGGDCAMLYGLNFDTNTIEEICADWCNNLKGYVSGKAVKYFDNLAGTLVLPNNLKIIGDNAFSHCNGFTGDLIIPDSVTTINSSVFYMCSFNGTLTLGNHLTTIGANAFYFCDFTGTLILPDTISSIGSGAFNGCLGFTGQLVIPSGLTIIQDGVFSGCYGLSGQLVIPDKITSIGANAFRDCFNIRDIKIGTYKKIIGSWYKDNSKLTSIGENAFYSQYKILTTLDTKNRTAESYDWAGSNRLLSGATYTTYLNTAQDLTGTLNLSTGELVISGTGTDLDIPLLQCIGMLPLTTFTWQTDTVENICNYWCCNTLNVYYYMYRSDEYLVYPELTGTLNLPNSIKIIGNHAFEFCMDLTGNLTLPTSLENIGKGAFMACESLTGDLIIPDSVTVIGGSSFAFCSGLNGTLIIPDSVTSIDQAFIGCNNITNIVIGSGVESISDMSFACTDSPLVTTPVDTVVTTSNPNAISYDWASDMRNVTFIVDVPLSTTGDLMGHLNTSTGEFKITGDGKNLDIQIIEALGTIGGTQLLQNIKTLNFEADKIETICDCWCYNVQGDAMNVFADLFMPNLSGCLNLPSTVKSIGAYAFDGCSGFTGNLILPNNLQTIGEGAFYNCTGFTGDIVIPDSITEISAYAFAFCSGFDGKIAIPDSVTTIANFVFGGCNSITSIEIGNGIESIEQYSFVCCNCDEESRDLVLVETPVPTRLKTRNEVALNYNWSSDMREVTYVIQKYTLNKAEDLFGYLDTETGEMSVEGTGTNLDKQLYRVLTTTEERAALKSLIFNTDTIENIGYEWCLNGYYVYETNENLYYFPNLAGELILPSNLKTIGNYAFSKNPYFVGNLIIPDGVTTIGNYAFNGCVRLSGDLVIPNSVTSLGKYAFSYCYSFDGTLTLSSSLTVIEDNVFEGCTGLRGDLIVPDGVTSIGSRAFGAFNSDSRMFENGTLTLPDSVITIKSDAFNYCRFTGALKLPKELVTIGDRAFNWTRFTSIEFNDKLTTIGGAAFNDCMWLRMNSLVIPDSVTTIKYNAFSSIPVNKFYIGKNVETLGNHVFESNNTYKTKLYTTSDIVKNYDWAGDKRTIVPMNTFTIALPQEISLKPKYLDADGSPVWHSSFNMEITGDFEDGSYGTFGKVQSFTIGSESGDTRTVTTSIEDTTVNENGTITVPVELTAPDPTLLEEFTGELKLNTVLHEMIPFAA